MTSNISLSYPNRIDEATVTGSANWSTELPLSNVQDRILAAVARTNTANPVPSETIKINLGVEPRMIGCVALVAHNLSTSATVQFIGYSGLNYTGSVRFDSTSVYRAWPILFPPTSGKIAWESNNFWSGTVAEDQRKSYTHIALFYAPRNQICRSVKIIINDPSNADHYLEIGRIFLGSTIEPEINPEWGDIAHGYVDLTEVQRAGATKYFYEQPKMRTLDVLLKHLSQSEALSGFYDAQREVGLSGEVLYAFSKPEYIVDDAGTINQNMTKDENFYAMTFLANFVELSPITRGYYEGFSTALKLEEII